LVSATRPMPNLSDSIALFQAARNVERGRNYWSLPAAQSWRVTVGDAAVIRCDGPKRFRQAAAQIEELTSSSILDQKGGSGPIFIGGFRFDPAQSANGLWSQFGDGVLALPRWAFSTLSDAKRFVTCSVVIDHHTNVDSLRGELANQATALFSSNTEPPRPTTGSINAEPIADSWRGSVEEALGEIKDGKIAKVTLARVMKLHATSPIPPEAVLRNLQTNYPECHTFAFCRNAMCFVGASPEELVSIHGDQATSTCLAGSAPRGLSEKEDAELSRQMLDSVKERREHAVVVEWISQRMMDLCNKLRWNEIPDVLRLGNVQHLATRFAGTPKKGCHVLSFVEALHPTPAVGGIPLQPALETIKRLENFDRGWYGGPIGWVDQEGNGEFDIAIRCALLRGNEAYLYAGAGIVSGSDPEHEDQETIMKFKPLLTALNAS